MRPGDLSNGTTDEGRPWPQKSQAQPWLFCCITLCENIHLAAWLLCEAWPTQALPRRAHSSPKAPLHAPYAR